MSEPPAASTARASDTAPSLLEYSTPDGFISIQDYPDQLQLHRPNAGGEVRFLVVLGVLATGLMLGVITLGVAVEGTSLKATHLLWLGFPLAGTLALIRHHINLARRPLTIAVGRGQLIILHRENRFAPLLRWKHDQILNIVVRPAVQIRGQQRRRLEITTRHCEGHEPWSFVFVESEDYVADDISRWIIERLEASRHL
jgi:hypothetical protein